MTKKTKYQYSENGEDTEQPLSRSQKKRNSAALQEIGERITKLPLSKIALLPLTDDLSEAFKEYFRLTGYEAKRRQLQFIGRLMREAGPKTERIAEALQQMETGRRN